MFSQFYLTTDMPQQLSYKMTRLKPHSEYRIEVTAYDSYDNKSEPLTAFFRLNSH